MSEVVSIEQAKEIMGRNYINPLEETYDGKRMVLNSKKCL